MFKEPAMFRHGSRKMFLKAAPVLAVVLFTAAAMGQCDDLDRYHADRLAMGEATPAQQRALAQAWLPVLAARAADPACGSGVASARWHAMSLANLLEDWTLSRELAEQGRHAAAERSDRALWQMNVAGATFHGRIIANQEGLTDTVRQLDSFLALAPAMVAGVRTGQPPVPAWLLPSLNALTWKAVCLREMEDFSGAAFTEQRAVTIFAAARIEPDVSFGGFLPEEAYYRASVDWLRANRPAEAAGSLATISFLGGTIRPAGQHTWNAIFHIASNPEKVVAFLEEAIRQMGVDEWSVLQAADAASLVHNMRPESLDLVTRAIACINQALTIGVDGCARADAALQAIQATAEVPAGLDQQAGQYALLLRHRARLEMDSGDWAAAQITVRTLRDLGSLLPWTEEALVRIARRW